MNFIAFFQAAENGDRIFDGRLVDHDRLETPFEGGVLFDVFLIFVEGRSHDAAQVAAGQHRFQDIAGVHRSFGRAGAGRRCGFIDEEENLTVGFCDFI